MSNSVFRRMYGVIQSVFNSGDDEDVEVEIKTEEARVVSEDPEVKEVVELAQERSKKSFLT